MIEDIIRAMLGLTPGSKKINADLAAMRHHVKPLAEQLIPWKEEKEIELMSLNLQHTAKKKGLDKIQFGNIQSIYFEPMVAFAYKDYIKGVRDALLICRTKNLEFIYRIKKKDIDVYFNGNQVAIIDQNSVMYGLKSRSVLGRIKSYSNDLLAVIIKDKDAGHLFNPLRPHSHQQRAFTLLRNLNDEEESIFLSLSLYELVTRLISK